MAQPLVLYECKDGVALLTLNRPDRMNAWTGELGEAWFDALDRAAADPEARVIVVTGAGRAWCAGADMGGLQQSGKHIGKDSGTKVKAAANSPMVTGEVLDSKGRWGNHAQSVPKPVIACVNGAVAGGGFSQMMSCDIRFAAAGAPITTAFARRGLIAEWGVSWSLPRAIGMGNAMDMMLSARKMRAEEMLQAGVMQRVYPKDELLPATLAYARDIAQNVPPSSLAVIKAQLLRHQSMPARDALKESNRLMVLSLQRPNFKEGVESYVQKRVPNYPAYDKQEPLVQLLDKIQKEHPAPGAFATAAKL